MLLVRARAGLSQIHGVGLISQDFIPAGTRVWVFQEGFDRAFLPAELDGLAVEEREQVFDYGWLDEKWGRVLLSADDDRFTNHSDSPNTCWSEDGMVAVRDILSGEEITLDYRELGGADQFACGVWLAKQSV